MSLFLNVLGFSIGKSDCEDSNNLLEIKNKVLRNELEKAENKIVDLEDKYIKTYEVMITDNSTGGTDTVYNHFYADSNNNKKKSDRELIKLADSSILAVNSMKL